MEKKFDFRFVFLYNISQLKQPPRGGDNCIWLRLLWQMRDPDLMGKDTHTCSAEQGNQVEDLDTFQAAVLF
jgi:hypothetical protein